MSEHTPGPWNEVDGQVRSSDSRVHVADVYHNSQSYGVANARLIAAAPDMLAALEGLLEFAERCVDHDALKAEGGDDGQGHYEGEYWWSNAVISARAAIAKARGKA